MALYFEPDSTASCVIASSPNLSLLAAGTLPAPGVLPSLSILRAASTGAHGEPDLFRALDCFSSPAAFRSICWSPPSTSTSAAGLVAGGLDNGMVALWDSRRVWGTPTPLTRCFSGLQFSPKTEHEVVHTFGDPSEACSVWLLDLRSPKTYRWKLCAHSEGTNSLSWSSMGDLILVGTNNSKIIIVSSDDEKIISEMSTATKCFDLEWSNTVQRSFFASFERELTAYALE